MLEIKDVILEACVESFEEAKNAERLGANRIELCSRLDLDGLTPERDNIVMVKNNINLPIKVMIRPRSGNFVYKMDEIKNMELEIEFCKKIGIQQIVLGVLNNYNEIDIDLLNRLSDKAMPMDITFHKAIDHTKDIIQQLELLCEIESVKSVLTSGGIGSLLDNKRFTKILLDKFSTQIKLILAGSITKNNFKMIHKEFQAMEYHGKRIVGNLKSK